MFQVTHMILHAKGRCREVREAIWLSERWINRDPRMWHRERLSPSLSMSGLPAMLARSPCTPHQASGDSLILCFLQWPLRCCSFSETRTFICLRTKGTKPCLVARPSRMYIARSISDALEAWIAICEYQSRDATALRFVRIRVVSVDKCWPLVMSDCHEALHRKHGIRATAQV